MQLYAPSTGNVKNLMQRNTGFISNMKLQKQFSLKFPDSRKII